MYNNDSGLGVGWGYSTTVMYEWKALSQGPTPYHFIHWFGRKGTLFHFIPSLDKWYPFQVTSL